MNTIRIRRPLAKDYRDHAEPEAWRHHQRVTDHYPGAPLLALAVWGVLCGSAAVAYALYRIVGPFANWLMQR